MLRTTRAFLSNEFKSKSWKDNIIPHHTYGTSYMFWGRQRSFWKRSVALRTTDQSRLMSYEERQAPVLRDLLAAAEDGLLGKDEKKIALRDLRVDDFRAVDFQCGKCGHTYRRTVKARTHYHKGCPKGCDAAAHRIATRGTAAPTLAEVDAVAARALLLNGPAPERGSTRDPTAAAPEVVAVPEGKKHPWPEAAAASEGGDASAPTSSSSNAAALARHLPADGWERFKFKCGQCSAPYEASVRAVTGQSAATGQPALSALRPLQKLCPTCRFGAAHAPCAAAVAGVAPGKKVTAVPKVAAVAGGGQVVLAPADGVEGDSIGTSSMEAAELRQAEAAAVGAEGTAVLADAVNRGATGTRRGFYGGLSFAA